MKLPDILKEVKGTKRKRDLLILFALASGLTQQGVADKVKISRPNVTRISLINSELLDKLTMQVELARKGGRLRHAFRILRYRALSDPKHRSTSKKDDLDWLDYIRKEVEGEKGTQIKVQTNVQVNQYDNLEGQELIDECRRQGVELPTTVEKRLKDKNSQA